LLSFFRQWDGIRHDIAQCLNVTPGSLFGIENLRDYTEPEPDIFGSVDNINLNLTYIIRQVLQPITKTPFAMIGSRGYEFVQHLPNQLRQGFSLLRTRYRRTRS